MPKTIAQPYTKTKGVGHVKADGTWRSFIRLNGKQTYLGTYDTEVEAICGRMGGELIYLGEVVTTPTPETQGFYDTMMDADNPYWYALAAVRSKIKSHDGITFNSSRNTWVSYTKKDSELIVLGDFKTYTDACTRTLLEQKRLS